MSWHEMTVEEQAIEQVKADHGMHAGRMEAYRWQHGAQNRWGESWRQGYRRAWWDALAWILHAQGEWESLTPQDAVAELVKDRGSIYWPIFQADPVISADCPGGHRTVLDKRGVCDECGLDFMRNV